MPGRPAHSVPFLGRPLLRAAVYLLLLGVPAAGCRREPAPPATEAQPTAAEVAAGATLPPLPTLLPTATPLPDPSPTVTRPPREPTATPPPLDLDQIAVDIRYAIPEIGLVRRLQGTIASRIALTDERTGQTRTLRDQAGVLLELQATLPVLQLGPLPDDCPGCVQLDYSLPAANTAASGWLTDTQFLASIENYTAVHLGPHWPAGTRYGLRRSAAPGHPAHTLAVTAEGTVFFWQATESTVAPATVDEALPAVLAGVRPDEEPAEFYAVNCAGGTTETLFWQTGDDAGDGNETTGTEVRLACPEFALPTTLAPLYDVLAMTVERQPAAADFDFPSRMLSVRDRLVYRRPDGRGFFLSDDDSAAVALASGQAVPVNVTDSDVLSLTLALSDLGVPLVDVVPEEGPMSGGQLWFRDEAGMHLVAWSDATPAPLLHLLQSLDGYLEDDSLIPAAETATPGTTPTPEAGEP